MDMQADDFVWGVGNVKEIEMDKVTAEEFEKLCESCFKLKNNIKERESKIKDDKGLLDEMHQKVLEYLEKYNKTKHVCALGTLSKTERMSVKLPQGENKKLFFDYLKEKGVFEDLVHINSRTLQSMYRQEIEAHINDGDPGWEMPGIEGAVTVTTVSMRAAK